MIEIKIYGTGGQGAVVAAKLLADAAAKGGFHVQSFAAYGAERRGGKVESYVRFSEEPFFLHCKMYEPDYVVLMDEIFTKDPATTSNLKGNEGVLINSAHPPEAFLSLGDFKTTTVDANRIAARNRVVLPGGMPVVNTTILGALVAILPGIKIDHLIEAIREGKIPAAEKNIGAAREAYDFVLSEKERDGVPIERVVETVPERRPLYREKRPPCEMRCPASHGIQRTTSLIQEDRFEDALENVKSENPFPGMTGRVCFHPCEAACNANEYHQGIAINALERAVSDLADPGKVKSPFKKASTGKKVAVIGGGPAGMTSAYFLTLLGHQVTVFEALPYLGGIPRVGIPAHRMPRDVVDKEMAEVIGLGVEVRTNTRVGKDVHFDHILKNYDACLVAAGAHRSLKVDVPGEEGEGVMAGLDFLKKVALGERVDLGRRVAIIGGGNTAVDAARSAKRLGAQEVTILYRRTLEEMPAYREEVEAAEREGIKIVYLTMPVKIHWHGERLDKLECMKTRLGEPDADGRRRPLRVEGSNFMLAVDKVITATGETLDISFLPEGIEMDGALIKVDELGRASMLSVFAAGDAANTSWNVSEAIGSGKRAAIGIDLNLRGRDGQEIAEAIREAKSRAVSMERYLNGDLPVVDGAVVSFSDLKVHSFSKAPRVRLHESPAPERTNNFEEVRMGLSRSQATGEATRCFQCGHCNLCGNCFIFCPDTAIGYEEENARLAINHGLCKGCGICIHECPRDAIGWEGEEG